MSFLSAETGGGSCVTSELQLRTSEKEAFYKLENVLKKPEANVKMEEKDMRDAGDLSESPFSLLP